MMRSFIICTVHWMLFGARGIHARQEKCIQNFSQKSWRWMDMSEYL